MNLYYKSSMISRIPGCLGGSVSIHGAWVKPSTRVIASLLERQIIVVCISDPHYIVYTNCVVPTCPSVDNDLYSAST